MDLALEMGLPFETLAQRMTEREFRAWDRYSQRKYLPARRMEIYMAQLAYYVVAAIGGAENLSVADFLLAPNVAASEAAQDAEVTEQDVEALKAEIGFRARGAPNGGQE